MRVLFALTYYRPHVSGLTMYVQRLAEALAAKGVAVTVLTSRYDAGLPLEEQLGDVRVVRVPVYRRIGKGVVMPTFPHVAARLMAEHDLASVHLPQFESGAVAALARLRGRPVVVTYHCDLRLPRGFFNRGVEEAARAMHFLAGALAHRVVGYTTDYAEHSPWLARFRAKRVIIPPPVDVPAPDALAVRAFESRHRLDGVRRIGFAARLATEKGVEYMLEALPRLLDEFPRLRVLFAGPHEDIVGETAYRSRLQRALARHAEAWTFLGVLSPDEMSTFYAACDVTVLPSINSTESFGLVQVESMLCGTPVVASNLPGVRVPVTATGMGEIVPPRDPAALASAVARVLRDRAAYLRPRHEVEQLFSTGRTRDDYLRLFEALV